MRKLYLRFGDKVLEVDDIRANSKFENRVGLKAKVATKIKKEIIIPTIFPIEYNKLKGKEYELNADDTDAIFKFISGTKIKREAYTCVSDKLWELVEDFNAIQIRIILYIAAKLKYNSNVFIADYEEMAKELNISEKTIKNNFIGICDTGNQIIIKTNKLKTFLVNHNVIFKGKLEDFINDYNVMYDGQKASFDEKGRVIIDSLGDIEL